MGDEGKRSNDERRNEGMMEPDMIVTLTPESQSQSQPPQVKATGDSLTNDNYNNTIKISINTGPFAWVNKARRITVLGCASRSPADLMQGCRMQALFYLCRFLLIQIMNL